MKKKSISIIIFIVLFLSCSELMLVKTRFINIDSDEEFMNLRFDFFSHKDSSKSAYVDIIEIYQIDKLLVRMIGDTFITSYFYPSIPEGFTITYPENNKELSILDKNNNYRFSFSGKVRYNAYGSWEYYALYSKNEGRWLFNERQIYSEYIKAEYESWIGNDIIMITLTNKMRIDDSIFYLTNECGERIKCEHKIKRIPTDKIALTLSEDQKPGKIIILNISNAIINKENGNGYYLKYVAEILSMEFQVPLKKAAEYYEQIAEILQEGMKSIVWDWQFGKGTKWTEIMRKDQAYILKDALTVERKGINELKRIVNSL